MSLLAFLCFKKINYTIVTTHTEPAISEIIDMSLNLAQTKLKSVHVAIALDSQITALTFIVSTYILFADVFCIFTQ
jgi:hypothetical protein